MQEVVFPQKLLLIARRSQVLAIAHIQVPNDMKAMLVYLAAFVAVALSAVVQQPMHKRWVPRRNPNTIDGHFLYKTGRGPQKALASSQGSGSQAIRHYYDYLYLTNITIGTPGQTLSVVVNTFIPNLYVVGDKCESLACTGSPDFYTRKRFNTTKSSTLTWNSDDFSFVNPDRERAVQGTVAVDTITLGGLTYDSQPFGVVSALSGGSDIVYDPGDGVLGLGWPNDKLAGATPVMMNLLPQLDLPIFTIWLDRLGGLITYGALDPVHCDAQVSYVTLSSKLYWQFTINSFQVQGFSMPRAAQAFSNSADASIGAPPAEFDAIISATGATYDSETQNYVLPCKGNHYPELVFTIGGNTLSVPATEYILDLGIGGARCVLMVYAAGTYGGFSTNWVLGDPFYRTFCHVHDMGNARMGFARAHHKEL